MVVYHGPETWNIPEKFGHLFDLNSELAYFCPEFRYLLYDLSRYDDDTIKGAAKSRVALLLLKYIFREDLPERLPEILGLLRNVAELPGGADYLMAALNCLISNSDKISDEVLTNIIKKTFADKGDSLMPTLAETWFQEGLEKGVAQGIQQGTLSTAHKYLVDILKTRFQVVPVAVTTRIN
ncbi:MAG: Rpn family recombination-promoting nuclease/putative transposase [Deltaproteobacteria bacterium]|nr:Rpn family recombination-promoting nuclease/putative transposase [Deltaproteobacteria bacterium]